MNIEYFQNNEKNLQVSLNFLEKWAQQVELAFQNWSSKLINKKCINEKVNLFGEQLIIYKIK